MNASAKPSNNTPVVSATQADRRPPGDGRRRTVQVAIAAVSCLALAACGGTRSTAASAGSPVAVLASTRSTFVVPGVGGPGSVTATLTAPVEVSGHVDTVVECTRGKRTYLANAASADLDGYQLAFTVSAVGYTGPGTYPTTVTVTLRQPDGTSTSVVARPKVPAKITSEGGSFELSAIGTNGRTLAASLSWACTQ